MRAGANPCGLYIRLGLAEFAGAAGGVEAEL